MAGDALTPTTPALDACVARIERAYPALWRDLLELRRLQHEASTAHRPVVFDLDRYRRLASGVHDDDPEAA